MYASGVGAAAQLARGGEAAEARQQQKAGGRQRHRRDGDEVLLTLSGCLQVADVEELRAVVGHHTVEIKVRRIVRVFSRAVIVGCREVATGQAIAGAVVRLVDDFPKGKLEAG